MLEDNLSFKFDAFYVGKSPYNNHTTSNLTAESIR